jgi:acid phosphatase (class A)
VNAPKAGAMLLFCALSFSHPAGAQQWESAPPPAHERLAPYLADAARPRLSAQPPASGSAEDSADLAAVEGLQQVSALRRAEAKRDALYVYPQFESAFGAPLSRTATPRTIAVLNRALGEVARAAFLAKDQYLRLRPYQRTQLAHVCGLETPPAPDPNASDRSSYPSGHAAFGWMTAAVLARLSPERAMQLFERANDYGQSRVICGLHFPSDVAAGEALADAVFVQLETTRAFRRDLEAARAEIVRLRHRQ